MQVALTAYRPILSRTGQICTVVHEWSSGCCKMAFGSKHSMLLVAILSVLLQLVLVERRTGLGRAILGKAAGGKGGRLGGIDVTCFCQYPNSVHLPY